MNRSLPEWQAKVVELWCEVAGKHFMSLPEQNYTYETLDRIVRGVNGFRRGSIQVSGNTFKVLSEKTPEQLSEYKRRALELMAEYTQVKPNKKTHNKNNKE